MRHTSWVMRLPPGLREQPAGIFIGILCFFSGMAYLFGVAESTAITRVLDPQWMKVWGGGICLAGGMIVTSISLVNKPLEAFGWRLLSVCCTVYMIWILLAAPLKNAAFTVVLCLILIVVGEVRVGVIKTLLRPLPQSVRDWTDNA